jgi:hypothetical protein
MKVRNKLTDQVRHAELHAGLADAELGHSPNQLLLVVFEGVPEGYLCRLAFEPERAEGFYRLVWANDEELELLHAAGFFLNAQQKAGRIRRE